jgi:hypothetical protein
MPRALSINSIIEKNKLASDVAWLLLLDVQVVDPATGNVIETLHLANNAEDFHWRDSIYVACRFDLALKQESGAQTQITLGITDYTNTVQQYMQLYAGGVGFPVTVTAVPATPANAPPEVQEFFEIIGAASAGYVCSFTLGTESALAKPFPRRRQMRDFCAWAYKDGNCKYTGAAPTCDLTLNGANGCSAHNNTVNFGGYPGIAGGGRYG